MTSNDPLSTRALPGRALALSLAALAVPVAGSLAFPELLGETAALLWLLALVPAFLLAYYRGWRGVATALALGMATLSITQVGATWRSISVPDQLLGVVIAYVAIALGIGWVAEVLHRERANVQSLAFTDLLTQLPNRRHARVFLENEFAAAERGRALSVVLFDLDEFKQYNDQYGHGAGDEAFAAFSEILNQNTRRMNLSSRFGGEEFLAVLAGSEAEGARVFAERVTTSLREHPLRAGKLTVSAGVATYHSGMHTPDDLLAAADHALYRAKRAGRDRVQVSGQDGPESTMEVRSRAEIGDPEAPSDMAPQTGRIDDLGYRSPDEVGRSAPRAEHLSAPGDRFGQGRRALVVEDDDTVRGIVSAYLERQGFLVTEARDAETGVRALAVEHDVVLTDLLLPGPSGNDLVAASKARWPQTQVMVMTAGRDAEIATESLNLGADRYIFKPFGMPDLRVHLVDSLTKRDRLLREESGEAIPDRESTERAELTREATLGGVRALVLAVEFKDPRARGHPERVARFAQEIARELDPDGTELNRESLRLGCELHDIGKIGVPDKILNKTGSLDLFEIAEFRKHVEVGRRILGSIFDDPIVLSIASSHHECWDGTGYPDGLSGVDIPLEARLVGLANALEAMTSPRSYRTAKTWEDAISEIRDLAGRQFDPQVVRAFEAALPRLHEYFEATRETRPSG